MGEEKKRYLFGGIAKPRFTIYYDHMQCDHKLKNVKVPAYLKKFQIPAEYITDVKNQPLTNCWIYATTAMYEIFALSHGMVSSNTDDEAVLSETYMTYAAFDTKPTDTAYKNPYGMQVCKSASGDSEYGGSIQIDSMAFLIRGEAYATEKTDPMDLATQKNNVLAPRLRTITEGKCRKAYVTGFKMLEAPQSPYPDEKFVNDVKVNLLTYGAVTVDFLFADERQVLVNKRYACYCEENHPVWPDTDAGGHAVCIVGWDDDYPASNFKSGYQPKNNGAFLAKNSWGISSNYDGYIWLSYEDGTVTGACCITEMNADFPTEPLKVLNHGNLGAVSYYKVTGDKQINFHCIYETTGSGDVLDSIGFVCDVPCLMSAELIYNGATTTLFTDVLLEYAGYHVKKVSAGTKFQNKGDTFSINVTYKNINGAQVGVPIEYKDADCYTNVNLIKGKCFINNQDVADINTAGNKSYGNIVLPVILRADSADAKKTADGYAKITVPAPSKGMIRGLCTDYNSIPVEWRLEPYDTSNYYPNYAAKAKMYQITDAKKQITEQGIVNTENAALSNVYLTAIIGEKDEIIMRRLFLCSLDAPGGYTFDVSAVKDDNKVDVSGNFGVANAAVNVSCNGQTASTVTDSTGKWQIADFALYDPAQGWKDDYKNSSITVDIYDNQAVPVKICSAATAVTLSSPIDVRSDSKGGLIVTIIGVSAVVGVLAGLAYCSENGSATCPITFALGGKTYCLGSNFPRNQGYTILEGTESGSGPETQFILSDGSFDSLGSAENLEVEFEVDIDVVKNADAAVAYGGLAKKIASGGYIKNCTFSGKIESSGKSNVGCIFGEGENVTISDCRSSVVVTGAASCGGIAYKITGTSSIAGCEVAGALSSAENTGGIVAEMADGTITDCYVTSGLTGKQTAGIVPVMSGAACVKHCYTSGKIQAVQDGQACGIATGIDGNQNAVSQNVSVCSHISGDKVARVSLFTGTGNVAYSGMHCDTGKTFAEDGAALKDWYEFGTSALFETLGFDMTNTWEFVDTMMFLRLKGSAAVYNYPFYIIAQTVNGKFQVKVGQELTLTGFKNAGMAEIKWTGITPQKTINESETNLWTSDNTFVLTVPFAPTQSGSYMLLLSGTMDNDVYDITLPFEVLENA